MVDRDHFTANMETDDDAAVTAELIEYAFNHQSEHRLRGQLYAEILDAVEDGFLDRKLAHFADPSLLEADYELGFKAAELESKPAGFASVALHRSLLLDQAQVVRKNAWTLPPRDLPIGGVLVHRFDQLLGARSPQRVTVLTA